MVLETLNINVWAFLLSGLLAFALGAIWYHPKVMGQQWKEAYGAKGGPGNGALPFVASFFLWIVSACFYAFLAGFLGIADIQDFNLAASSYFLLSSMLWVAFAMPPAIMGGLYTGRNFDAVAIDASYQLAGYYMFAAVHIAFLYMNMG